MAVSIMLSFNDIANDIVVARPPMTQVRLASKYQIVIPEDVRGQLDLKPGQAFEVWAREGHVIAVPVRPLEEAFGMFPGLDTSDPRDHGERV